MKSRDGKSQRRDKKKKEWSQPTNQAPLSQMLQQEWRKQSYASQLGQDMSVNKFHNLILHPPTAPKPKEARKHMSFSDSLAKLHPGAAGQPSPFEPYGLSGHLNPLVPWISLQAPVSKCCCQSSLAMEAM